MKLCWQDRFPQFLCYVYHMSCKGALPQKVYFLGHETVCAQLTFIILEFYEKVKKKLSFFGHFCENFLSQKVYFCRIAIKKLNPVR